MLRGGLFEVLFVYFIFFFKLTSLMQDLIGDINELKDGQAKNASDLQRLNDNYSSLNDKFKNYEKLKDSFVRVYFSNWKNRNIIKYVLFKA
jgi:hypothetical protein